MSNSSMFVKYICLLCVIQLSVFLVGCDSDPYDGPGQLPDLGGTPSGDGGGTPPPAASCPISEVIVTASVQEGFNPLNVTFNVSSPIGCIEKVDWRFGEGDVVVTTGNASVSHIYVNPGAKSVAVIGTAADPLSENYEFNIPINVLPNVNLIVSSFAIDTDLTPGGLETVSAIIQNIGTDPLEGSGHIDIAYYLSTDNVITVDDIYIGDTSVVIGDSFTQNDVPFGFELLSPLENYQYDHQLAVKGNIAPGTYFAGAIVDYIDEYDWYTFPRSTDSKEFAFPVHVTVAETNETDNVRLLEAHQVTVNNSVCADDAFEPDNSSATATPISVAQTQGHNFCRDNSDWLQFDAVQGSVYKITTFALGVEADTQLILYDTDGSSILLFHDNMGNNADETRTVDLDEDFPPFPESEIVWEAQVTGTYFIKVRTTACDEDLNPFCVPDPPELPLGSPDGVGLFTGYSITLQ